MVEVIPPTRIDYDSDLVKHFVRIKGWLPAAAYRSLRVGSRNMRYLTFCAANAVDVFMLERAGHLIRDSDSLRLDDVYFCERRLEDFQRISNLVGSGEQGFLGGFEDIVLFEETELTRGLDLAEMSSQPRDHEMRRQLHLKEAQRRLRGSFPFDLLNLDISGADYPPYEAAASRMFRAIRNVLDWQNLSRSNGDQINEFTLLITAKVANVEINAEAIAALVALVAQNIQEYDPYRQEFRDKYGEIGVDELREKQFPDFFAIAFSKLLLNEAMTRTWDMEYRNVFLYLRRSPHGPDYHMVSLVSHLRRFRQQGELLVNPEGVLPAVMANRYVEESTETLHFSPDLVDLRVMSPDDRESIRGDLQGVVKFRDDFISSLRED